MVCRAGGAQDLGLLDRRGPALAASARATTLPSAAGSQPSAPDRTLSTVSARASSSREPARPGDARVRSGARALLPRSPYRTVLSRSGRSQLFQPSGRTTSDISVSRNAALAKDRHGRPRYVFTPGSPVMRHPWKTKPWRSSCGVEAAVM